MFFVDVILINLFLTLNNKIQNTFIAEISMERITLSLLTLYM